MRLQQNRGFVTSIERAGANCCTALQRGRTQHAGPCAYVKGGNERIASIAAVCNYCAISVTVEDWGPATHMMAAHPASGRG